MATPAQIAANRLNAQKSTGPRSAEGKAASRFNALKSGIDARSLVIPGEDPAELEALALDYRQQFHPAGPLEIYLVDTLVQADWKRRRLTRVQSEIIAALLAVEDVFQAPPGSSPLACVFTDDAIGPNVLEKVERQLTASQRGYFRALNELRRAQRERLAGEQMQQMNGARPSAFVSEPAVAQPAPPPVPRLRPAAVAPSQIGFVPSKPTPASPHPWSQPDRGAALPRLPR